MNLYHLTPAENLNSILQRGLIPNGGFVYLAESKDICLQLAPLSAAYYCHKRYSDNLLKSRYARLPGFLAVQFIEAICFKIDMCGLEEDITTGFAPSLETIFLHKDMERTYEKEYHYPFLIPPERIVDYEHLRLEYYVPNPDYKPS